MTPRGERRGARGKGTTGRRQLLAAMVLVVALIGLVGARVNASDNTDVEPSGDAAADGEETNAEPTPTTEAAIMEPERLGPAGTLTGLDGWLQTDATTFEDFDGQVRIVQFWTFGCHNCKATLPHLQEIYAEHRSAGLEIVGVHAPEFDYEKDPDSITVAAADLGVTWPIALDTNKTNFRSWQTGRRFWPRTFVIDQAGEIRFDRIGEGAYDELDATVAYLIENGP